MQNTKDDQEGHGWSTMEELKLVDLWRIHCADMCDFSIQLPIFRRISEEMRKYGSETTPQDCRRKMHVLFQKYNQERITLVDNDIFSITWPLFPLIHEIYKQKVEPVNLMILQKEVNEFLSSLRSDTPNLDESSKSMEALGDCSAFNPFQVTPTRLLQIREDIEVLRKQRNSDLQSLQLETRELAVLQKVFDNWQIQQQSMLQNLQKYDTKI